jgi:hypothetical protein
MAGNSYVYKAAIISYGKPGVAVRLSVPIHGNKPLKSGLLLHLMKMAGLDEKAGE